MSDPPPRTAGGRTRRTLAFGAAAAWVICLAGLAAWTANPVTLNRDQILLARSTGAIVLAEVLDARAGSIRIEEVLAASEGLPIELAAGRDVRTSGSLTPAGVSNGDQIVLPLVHHPGTDDLTLAPVPLGTPRAYPATPEVVAEVKSLLAEQ